MENESHIPVDPEEVFQRLVPSQYRREVMEALGASIILVHQSGPERWGVRLAPDSIMLKIGPHEVLQIHSWEWKHPFHLIIDQNSVPPELRSRPELWFSEDKDCYGNSGAAGYYISNPDSETCDMPFESVREVYQALLDSHTKIINRAATKRRHASTLRTHAPELILFVAAALGQSLPQPAYVEISDAEATPLTAEELRRDEQFSEGAARQILVNAYERDRRARQRCIEHYGARCSVCKISFEERYGPEAAGIIHVHHVVPLSQIGKQYEVDPIKDLRPVCPNCHTVIHATKQARTVEQVAKMIRSS
jgi:5-methylcytosine-specific restriction enzyme A